MRFVTAVLLLLGSVSLSWGQVTCSCTLDSNNNARVTVKTDGTYATNAWFGVYALSDMASQPQCPYFYMSRSSVPYDITYDVSNLITNKAYVCGVYSGSMYPTSGSNCGSRMSMNTFTCAASSYRPVPPPPPRWTPPNPNPSSNAGAVVAIVVPTTIAVFVVIGLIIFFIVRAARRARNAGNVQMSAMAGASSTSFNGGGASNVQYGQSPQMTFIPAPLPATATGVAPPTYIMSNPAPHPYTTMAPMQQMMYMPPGTDPTMSMNQPVFIATSPLPNK